MPASPKQSSREAKRSQMVTSVVHRNIRALMEDRKTIERKRNVQERFADWITAFVGSMGFVFVHAVWFGVWMLWNLNVIGLQPFDPFPFGLLTMIVSLEAIFLSTFVLISQNRMGELSDRRADLDVQINLLSEYEITKILGIVDALADHFNLPEGSDPELKDLERKIAPDAVLKEVEDERKL